jgi:predicted RND superfamily exporter protein
MKLLPVVMSMIIAMTLGMVIVMGVILYAAWPYILLGGLVYYIVKHNKKQNYLQIDNHKQIGR